jgi:hypothetical protein
MAKSQKRSNREARKPKTKKAKTDASHPVVKADIVAGLETKKNQ